MGDWIIAVIEAVYHFLWGDLICDSPAGRRETSPFLTCNYLNPCRDLFYGFVEGLLPIWLFPEMILRGNRKTREKNRGKVREKERLFVC